MALSPENATPSLWPPDGPGVVRLPSGRMVRGRGLRHPLPNGPAPTYAVYLLGERPPQVPWESRLLRWPDFRLPADRAEARAVLTEAWERAAVERVELACGGGRGRTGTALACLAVLDGVPRDEAVAWVRHHYHPRAVETPWQKRYARRFGAQGRLRKPRLLSQSGDARGERAPGVPPRPVPTAQPSGPVPEPEGRVRSSKEGRRRTRSW